VVSDKFLKSWPCPSLPNFNKIVVAMGLPSGFSAFYSYRSRYQCQPKISRYRWSWSKSDPFHTHVSGQSWVTRVVIYQLRRTNYS